MQYVWHIVSASGEKRKYLLLLSFLFFFSWNYFPLFIFFFIYLLFYVKFTLKPYELCMLQI